MFAAVRTAVAAPWTWSRAAIAMHPTVSGKRSMSTRVGWIGTGVMGASMAKHVASAGFDLSVYARSPEKPAVVDLVEATGARVFDSPAELASSVDVLCSIVGFPDDVHAVLLDDVDGALGKAVTNPPSLVIDLTTSQPALALKIAAAAQAQGSDALDAPVSGGDVGARNGQLSIMVGGSDAAFAAGLPILQPMAKVVTHMGGPGAGQHTKMVNQIAIAGGMIGMVEGLVYGHAAGLDLETVLEAISGGAAGSWSLSNYAPRMLKRDFAPGFYVEHFVKDLGIALDEARAMNLSLPGLALVQQLYLALIAQGGAARGTHALQLALESMNNIQIKDYSA
ncbi:3-hydroxyisobutyrate dehydrogenase [Thecamonas trahens ATCC 50062]|uniref:3-hydroxyisobutyrate dehydrogenase n=1 Tax=Thecamonas trahens ATCC 50062 TaxID=461836 RepID=A0A0L0DJB8_THETB|nr:3-hydroxyisobutyrate dehydrogenase [Thecamonas trahens ATCC 50062]KNC52300.1 3-hydroxyisobutyrate dehydrogenase [Thecamonas trahens ATCC 50062]|eukprot:XP_013762299.1 3-hydroxyisobutyrate dehydrogenase [Thecamonas trahens ATCC 50062]